MDADGLANYFADVCPKIPPVIEIPGRTHHVERSEKPKSTVVEETLKAAE
jgi:HrpA-like RNA helicase